MRFEHLTQTQDGDFQIPEQHLCDGCGYKVVFSEDAKCDTCVALEVFSKFASEMDDVFSGIEKVSRAVNDALMAVEDSIYDNPSLDIESEKAKIRQMIAKRIQGILSEYGLK